MISVRGRNGCGNDGNTFSYIRCNGANSSVALYDSSQLGQSINDMAKDSISTSQYKNYGSSAYSSTTDAYFLTIPANAAITFGTKPCCFDFWMYPLNNTNGLSWSASNSSGSYFPGIYCWGSYIKYYISGGYGAQVNIAASTWQHIAVVRTATELALYLDGVKKTSTAILASLTLGGNADISFGNAAAYYSDIRISVGNPRWTHNFTPPNRAY